MMKTTPEPRQYPVVVQVEPMVMRDLERVCALCEQKRRCAHELAAGTTSEHYEDFCPNALTLKTLVPTST